MQEIVPGPNTFEPPRLLMATVNERPPASVPNRARSIFFAPSQLGKEVESIQPDALSHQNVSNDTSTATGASLSNDKGAILDKGDAGFTVQSDKVHDAIFNQRSKALENNETAFSYLPEDSEVSEKPLLQQEQHWFHQNIKYIIGELLQEWQGFRNQTHDHHHGQPNDTGDTGPPPNDQGCKDSQKRKQDPEADGQEATSGPSNAAKRQKGGGEDDSEPPLACPFSKKDLYVYRECTKFGFKRARDVKQHLKRNHSPEVAEPIRLRLQKPSSRGTREQQWYEVFDILFPGHLSRPSSPYNDFEICQQPPAVASALDEALHIPYHYLMTEGAGILLQEIHQDPAFSSEGGPDINDMRRALGRLFGQYLNQQLERSPEAPGGNNGTLGQSLSSNRDTSQESLSLGSGRTSTLVSESADNSPGMPHYPDHQNCFIGDNQATESFAQYDNGNLLTVNQALEVEGQDLDTMTTSNDEEPLPSEFEELERGIYTDFLFDENISYP
jgi:hypothetical protein